MSAAMPCDTWIVGMGAHTPIGDDAWCTAAAARAGMCGFREHAFLVDSAGEPIRVAAVKRLDTSVRGLERYLKLLLPALDQALAGVPPAAGVPLALGLPPHRPGRPADLAQGLQQALSAHYGGRIHPILCFECGHAAAIEGLDAALKSLAKGSISYCLVAGVDSYLSTETLEWLEACDQLHGGGRLNNAWGFVPGEAAAALLVATGAAQSQLGTPAWARVLGTATAREGKLIKTDAVCIGEGLTAAFREAMAHLPVGDRIDDVYCDMNGEAYRADEYGFTALRTKQHFRAASDFVAPADCWGDVGAAGAPLHAILAIASCVKGYGHGDTSLVWASSESGERGAMLLRAPLNPRE